MGREKRMWEESQEKRWGAPDKYVCTNCVENVFLKKEIAEKLANRRCSYCGKSSRKNIAAPVAVIMEHIGATFFDYFENPDEAGVPYDGGDYAIDLNITAEDALNHLGLECNDALFSDVARSIGNDTLWVEAAGGVWLGEHQNEFLVNGWRKFVRVVKNESRFFFSNIPSVKKSFTEHNPSELLSEIGRIASELDLFKSYPLGTVWFRSRERKSGAVWPLDAAQMGPPPNDKAQAGRMNPAGISYFYLATERETALAELMNKPPCVIVVGCFSLCRDLRLLDLINFPPLPSVFDRKRRNELELLLFLLEFTRQISQPVEKNGQREHIDYVPTQVVCEYFAKVFRTKDGYSLDGLAYPSAVRPGGTNIVLFPPLQRGKELRELVKLQETSLLTFNHWMDFYDAIR